MVETPSPTWSSVTGRVPVTAEKYRPLTDVPAMPPTSFPLTLTSPADTLGDGGDGRVVLQAGEQGGGTRVELELLGGSHRGGGRRRQVGQAVLYK